MTQHEFDPSIPGYGCCACNDEKLPQPTAGGHAMTPEEQKLNPCHCGTLETCLGPQALAPGWECKRTAALAELAALRGELATLRQQLESAPWKASYKAEHARAEQAEAALADLRQQVATLTQERDWLRADVTKIDNEREDAMDALAECQQKLEATLTPPPAQQGERK